MKDVTLSYKLYSFVDGTFKVDYIVPGQAIGNRDLAVSHTAYQDGKLVQAWTNRLYWSGHGQDKEGHWNIQVQAGTQCSGVVVDLDQPLAIGQWEEVSNTVEFTVE